MPFGTQLSLGAGDIVLDGDPVPARKGAQQPRPHFSAHFALARSPISATAELLLKVLRQIRGSGDGSRSPSGVRERSPSGGSGAEIPFPEAEAVS